MKMLIFENETKVELETLTLLGFSRTTAYLALLFLAMNTDYDINQEKVRIVDINIDADSASWNATVTRDSTSWKHYWVPGSMMNSEIIRLQIVSTPTIIVTDSLGKQLYRGNDGTKARQTVESL